MNIHQKFDVWSLVQNNEFEKACEIADAGYEAVGYAPFLRNKVYALFHLERYIEAVHLSDKLIEIEGGRISTDYIHSGIANWILGNYSKSIEAWQEAQNCNYKDAVGGMDTLLLLYFAAIKTNDGKLRLSAVREIKKLLKSKLALNYPGPLGHYLLEEITEKQLIGYVAKVPILKERELCQAHFVSAIKVLEKGDTNAYYRKLRECINYGSASYLEGVYYLAKAELENRTKSDNP